MDHTVKATLTKHSLHESHRKKKKHNEAQPSWITQEKLQSQSTAFIDHTEKTSHKALPL